MCLFVVFLVGVQSMLEEGPISLKCLQNFIFGLVRQVGNSEELQKVFVVNYFFCHYASFFNNFNFHSGLCEDYKLTIHIIKNSVNYSFNIKATFSMRMYFKKINAQSGGALHFDINFICYWIDILQLDKKYFTVEICRSLIFLFNLNELFLGYKFLNIHN